MTQMPKTFIREVALIIWGEEAKAILNRCFHLEKISVSFKGRSPRKQFEEDKLQLLRGTLILITRYHVSCLCLVIFLNNELRLLCFCNYWITAWNMLEYEINLSDTRGTM